MNNILASIDWFDMYSTNVMNIVLNKLYKELLKILNILAKKKIDRIFQNGFRMN